MKTTIQTCLFYLCLISNVLSGQNSDDSLKIFRELVSKPDNEKINSNSKNGKSFEDSIIFQDSFENGAGNWSQTGCWQVGHPTSGPNNGFNSTNCAATNLAGYYPNNANDWLISPVISLPESASQVLLSFYEWFNLESNYDFGRVKLSFDDGFTWTQLSIRNGTGNWKSASLDLTTYKGKNIKLGFNLTSDGTVMKEGWYIDDILIIAIPHEPLSASIHSINPQNFPLVYLNMNVESYGTNLPSLSRSDFEIFENGILQTGLFEVTPPQSNGGQRLADIVFIIDNSGNMDGLQAQLRNNLTGFLSQLSENGVDVSLGLCRFGQSANNGNPIPEDEGQLTKNESYFRDNVWLRNVSNGSREPGFYAITQSVSGFCFRPGAQKIFVIMTNENPDQGGATLQQTINACTDSYTTLFALTSPESALLNLVSDATMGKHYNIYDPLSGIFNDIVTLISQSYILRYRSENSECDGQSRNIEIFVNHAGNQTIETGSFIPCKFPELNRTPETEALHDQSWPVNTQFAIKAKIVDLFYPFVNQVRLFYKNTTATSYQTQWMTSIGDNIWQGIIPSNVSAFPGVDYYIIAGDGSVKVSNPAIDPSVSPFQLAINPNQSPAITHVPVQNFTLGIPLAIHASISDNTNVISTAKLFFRKTGQILWQQVQMDLGSGNQYSGIIPPDYTTIDGVEYFISACDDLGVRTDYGSPNQPHEIIEIVDGIYHCMQPGWQIISSFVNPTNPGIEFIMADMAEQEAFTIMLNRQGVYWPSHNCNTIVNWNVYSGYKINVVKPTCLLIQGEMPVNKTVNLYQGVNYMPVIDDEPVDAETIFGQISGKFTYALDIRDNLIYWPAAGMYTLQTLEPGKGYLLLMQSNSQVTFPETSNKSSAKTSQ